MKNITLILLFLTTTLVGFSQEEVKKEKKEEKKTEKIIEKSQTQIEQAQKNYDDIRKALQENRADRIQLENELESNRIALRKAKQELARRERTKNPLKTEPYKVIQNPIFEEMSMGMQNGFSIYMPTGKKDGLGNLFSKNVNSEFKTYMKNYNVDKVKKKKGELFFDNVSIPEVSATPVDLFVDIVKEDTGVTLKSFVNTGDEFLDFSTDTNAAKNARNILTHFAKYVRKTNLEKQLKEEENELEKTQKDLERAKEDIISAKEDINKAENEIAENRGKIAEAETLIDGLNRKLEKTRNDISRVNM